MRTKYRTFEDVLKGAEQDVTSREREIDASKWEQLMLGDIRVTEKNPDTGKAEQRILRLYGPERAKAFADKRGREAGDMTHARGDWKYIANPAEVWDAYTRVQDAFEALEPLALTDLPESTRKALTSSPRPDKHEHKLCALTLDGHIYPLADRRPVYSDGGFQHSPIPGWALLIVAKACLSRNPRVTNAAISETTHKLANHHMSLTHGLDDVEDVFLPEGTYAKPKASRVGKVIAEESSIVAKGKARHYRWGFGFETLPQPKFVNGPVVVERCCLYCEKPLGHAARANQRFCQNRNRCKMAFNREHKREQPPSSPFGEE